MYWNLDEVIVCENENLPIDWKRMSPSGRVFVEIGFGNGEFTEFIAKNNPDVLVVGIEVSQSCVLKAARRALFAGLKNMKLMHGDARYLLRHCFAPESVERVYMNYPCPWPKTRHAERRVTVPGFSSLLNHLLRKDGIFDLATDVDWYAEEAGKTIAASGAFDVVSFVKNPARPYITKYERKWREMNKDLWELVMKKNGKIEPGSVKEELWEMAAEVDTRKKIAQIIKEIRDVSGTDENGEGHWVYRDTFLSDSGVGLALLVTADEGFEQHFYIKLIANLRGGITVKVDSVGHPYRTPAMRAALAKAIEITKE